ncbi:oxygen-independent coproporphyrinogen III oxidase [Sphingomonas colocasiae]|uniref:Coproporphyrinogen-III oxidase n=1 Tax=Sphingomonas colocasiae TaxID=1848973 RepID=A0ABS7PPY1_9SPHN|nr:oxygen-independent coproporphyrinogen III oxidase [Sphingomonas colocasiae]MBY8822089.1 oxygen-independent coproporphyrinogen III oxidase [Sphingomonas colocasiae]
MWTHHPDLLATPVPRYTSYPTAAEFHDGPDTAALEGALAAIGPDAPVSLYVHIPFCREICWYCGCNTGAANRDRRLTAYLEALTAEIAMVGDGLAGRGRLQRISFGGGSPNAIAPTDFIALAEALRVAFGAPKDGLSVEIDPRGFSHEWAGVLGAMGAERVSLGVQTFAEPVQRAIGRVQPAGLIERTTRWLRDAGIGSINFDLMYGLPHQGLADLAETLEMAVAMQAERIALFGYAHVPHLIPRQRRIDGAALPDGTLRFAQAGLGHRMLAESGYAPIGFDHFALPADPIARAARAGTLRRNFQGFTDDPSDVVIGLGASSISMFPDRILQNEKNAGRYRMMVSAGRLPVSRGLFRTAEDRLRGRIIEALLCTGAADTAGLSDRGETEARIAPFVARGLAEWTGATLRLSADAAPYARAIAAAFDTYRQPDARRFSNAI